MFRTRVVPSLPSVNGSSWSSSEMIRTQKLSRPMNEISLADTQMNWENNNFSRVSWNHAVIVIERNRHWKNWGVLEKLPSAAQCWCWILRFSELTHSSLLPSSRHILEETVENQIVAQLGPATLRIRTSWSNIVLSHHLLCLATRSN